MRRETPFNSSGSGYRDALIWESVCELAADGSLAFVTENSKDFAASDRQGLAEDLIADLSNRGLPQGVVTVSPSLLEVIVDVAPQAMNRRVAVQQLLERPTVRRQLEEEFRDGFATHEGIPYPARPGELHPLMYDAAVEAVWNVNHVVAENVISTGDTTEVVFGTALADARAYSRRENVDISDVDAARGGRAAGLIDDWYQEGGDLIMYRQLPVSVAFEASLEPDGTVWNAGVVAVFSV